MKIYNSNDQLILDVEVDDSSYRHRVIKGDHNLTLKYALAEHVELPVGAYCLFQGQRYTLERPEALKMKHSRNFEYTVTMEAYQAKAKIWKFRNPVDGRLKFSLTAKPIEHLQMFVDNMNRRDTGWTVGDCIDGVEHLISYDHAYCYEALSSMASEFDTEFEIVGKRVSLRKVEYNKNNPLPLSYGCGNGFKAGLGRSNSSDTPPVEILYTQGGEDNIDRSKYGNSELLLPKGQEISYDGEYFEDEAGYKSANARRYVVDDLGLSIRRADKTLSSLAEDSLDCSDIYPKHVGTITSVVTVDADNHFYDIIDNTIPPNLNYEDCLIAGETMTIIFQSGMLAGREFEVKYYHESKTVKGVQKAARRFEIVPQEIDGVTMPDATFLPAVNDTYAVFNVMLPDAYICDNDTKSGAEWDMFRTAVKYMFDNEEQKFTFTGELDGLWAKKDWTNIGGRIVLGGYILFHDEHFQEEGVLVRITGIKDYINKPHSPVIEISNDTVSSGFSSTIKTLESEEVLVEKNHRDALQFTKRRFRDARETIEMLEASLLDNFTNSINPIAVQTMAMLVGDESLQFQFLNEQTFAYDKTTKVLTASAGQIQHMTLGITDLKSSHDDSEYKTWTVSAYTSAVLDDSSKKYYLYIKASKSAQTAEFILSETAIGMYSSKDYYYFLVGILNSEYDGERSFAPMYGFTEILPGRITTDRVVSSSGKSYFDMLANAMKLGDALDFNSQGDGKLRLRGTLVQSEAGTESYIGCYRGEYDDSYTYYNGDEVIYTYNGVTSTYRYINDTASSGHTPTETLYWQVIAQGAKGADGKSVSMKGTAFYHFETYAEAQAATVDIGKTCLLDNAIGNKPGTCIKSTSGWAIGASTVGDGYIMNDTGHLWMCSEDAWEDIGSVKGDKGDKGATGATGNYTELRFAKNGSTSTPPSLVKTVLAPTGWSLTVPSVGTGEYLWCTRALKTGDGKTLVMPWSTPFRLTPYDGTNGTNGKSPVMVYRGVYDSNKTYYGNDNRLDCVKSGDTYYIARIDAGEFSTPAPPDTSKWNAFGASFESIATNLLLAEGANIGDWFISDGKIVSTLESGNKIELDAVNKIIKVYATDSEAEYQEETLKNITIKLDANSGIIEARDNSYNVAYMSPTGIFANRAGTKCVSATTGWDQRAAIVGLGFANMDKSAWSFGQDQECVSGVYGIASNSGTAPYYGGYFYNLKVKGLIYGIKYITSNYTYLTDETTYAVGFGSSRYIVYLPAATREGQTIFFKQWWNGSLRIYPRSGQKLYDDHTENDYYDVKEGQLLAATFVRAAINGENVEVWLVNKYSY